MRKKLLIIGYGSAGRKFAIITRKYFKNLDIIILTKQKKTVFKVIKSIKDIKELNPDYIIISSPTKFHLYHLQVVNKFFNGKRILIEKPLYSEFKNLKNKKNKIF